MIGIVTPGSVRDQALIPTKKKSKKVHLRESSINNIESPYIGFISFPLAFPGCLNKMELIKNKKTLTILKFSKQSKASRLAISHLSDAITL